MRTNSRFHTKPSQTPPAAKQHLRAGARKRAKVPEGAMARNGLPSYDPGLLNEHRRRRAPASGNEEWQT